MTFGALGFMGQDSFAGLNTTLLPRGQLTASWWAAGVAMVVVTTATIVGNIAVVAALRRARRMPTHYPLASLAVADLLVGTCVLPLAVARELFTFTPNWAICACWCTLDVLCCTASILSLCALGWERWCGINWPLARDHRERRAKLLAALVWPIATIVALPTAFVPSPMQFYEVEMPKACSVNTNTGYVFFSVTVSFYIPCSVMVVLYGQIVQALAVPPPIRAHRGRKAGEQNATNKADRCTPERQIQENQKADPASKLPEGCHLNLPGTPVCCAVPSPLKPYSPGGAMSRQRRATITIVRLMSLFLICWFPFFIMLPLDSLCDCVWDSMWQWCTWLGYLNSALDPLVYAAASPSVRRALLASTALIRTSSSSTQ